MSTVTQAAAQTQTQPDGTPAKSNQKPHSRSRISRLVAQRAKMGPEQLRMPHFSIKTLGKAVGVAVLVGGSLAFFGPIKLAFAAAGYFLGKNIQKARHQEEITRWLNQATQPKTVNPFQERGQEPFTQGEPQTPVQNHQVFENQTGMQPAPSPAASREPSLASPVALQHASQQVQREGKRRKGPIRSTLSFIANMFTKMINHYRENHTIRGLDNKVFSLQTEAAQTQAFYDRQIAEAREAAHQHLEKRFDFARLKSIEGKDQATRRRDKETVAALSTGLEEYRMDTNQPKASLSEFLFAVHEDPSLAEKYGNRIPEHVRDEVTQTANNLNQQTKQIEVARTTDLNTIEALRVTAVHRLHTMMGRQARGSEVLSNFRARLNHGQEKIKNVFSKNKEAGYAR